MNDTNTNAPTEAITNHYNPHLPSTDHDHDTAFDPDVNVNNNNDMTEYSTINLPLLPSMKPFPGSQHTTTQHHHQSHQQQQQQQQQQRHHHQNVPISQTIPVTVDPTSPTHHQLLTQLHPNPSHQIHVAPHHSKQPAHAPSTSTSSTTATTAAAAATSTTISTVTPLLLEQRHHSNILGVTSTNAHAKDGTNKTIPRESTAAKYSQFFNEYVMELNGV
jgi:hypothetical protein